MLWHTYTGPYAGIVTKGVLTGIFGCLCRVYGLWAEEGFEVLYSISIRRNPAKKYDSLFKLP